MTEIMLDKQKTLNEIGTRIRRLRESKNLSIQEFADKLEIEYNNVIRIEKGRTNFTIGTLVKIARYSIVIKDNDMWLYTLLYIIVCTIKYIAA